MPTARLENFKRNFGVGFMDGILIRKNGPKIIQNLKPSGIFYSVLFLCNEMNPVVFIFSGILIL